MRKCFYAEAAESAGIKHAQKYTELMFRLFVSCQCIDCQRAYKLGFFSEKQKQEEKSNDLPYYA